ncbi:MAG: phosphoribosylformylglycinamidine synthase subunit PurL [Thermus sp.]|uniref:phosphoribosylformylglycinamidine synthase subunit PurL n=1 Tax=Thermus sp. TaxID=275 RepID=UPI0025E9D7F5|nr:phosphoribosylformylglycinamidine synthase subunit PurL [Thermus sp.]MCS6868875.1 phosphoribosylformylglycinamidine synthase subunit PurL [Thermus sp.]MCS7218429.1 phosphoribosylformylglycinamidine synthase subunit PurL [Thermus sp.]MCX7849249.1 phosphoribosylformylglycinamidine synthase subunit PurL [Thermus sp.]MDW8016816.1 phosphoribosylformylglycinamidine synthase subunit PurL [Thermus sp.]MDW8356967.1 phosphoribosylformylglycinamidine synthase subunit PurL [Thermus sp.]
MEAFAKEIGIPEEEYRAILRKLGREPNRVELFLFKVMWSEHCAYKNSRPLLKELPKEGEAVLQGPGENAGVVRLGEGWAVAFKIESHNHPSAVEPFQGAATGVGGILRDIMSMGARPIALLDSLRFGPPQDPRSRYLFKGVVAGIAHYGNAIGVPTVGGDLYFHEGYRENPLVNAMCLGLLREEQLKRSRASLGRPIYYAGAKTGRDGIGGAAFASKELGEDKEEDRPAVQVGDPFLGKLLMEATLEAIERDLVEGVQDMGAAGLTSSLSELAHKSGLGVELDLDRVPTREAGMGPIELLLSESQERMVLVPKEGKEEALEEVFRRWGLDCVAVARTVPERVFRVRFRGEVVAEVPTEALAEAPTYVRVGREDPEIRRLRETPLPPLQADPQEVLPRLLSSPNLASREAVYERYDHQVGTRTALLPGRGDAAVLWIKGTHLGLAAKVDQNPRYSRLHPRLGAMHALAEACRNVSVVGARPLAYTDGLNLGSPETPEGYFELKETLEGLKEASEALGVPVVSGNVSLYNESGGRRIPPTAMVGVVGVLDIRKRAEMGFRRPGEVILLLGEARGELGASELLYLLTGLELGHPPTLDLVEERRVQEAIRELIGLGLTATAHDLAEGGLLVALAEMTFPYGLGATVEVRERGLEALFGEAPSRILLTVAKEKLAEATGRLEALGLPYRVLGETGGETLTVLTPEGVLEWEVRELMAAWKEPLREVLDG